MYELFFFSEDIISSLHKHGSSTTPSRSQYAIVPNGKPFVLDSNGYPDKELNKFFDYLCSPARKSINSWKTYAIQLLVYLKFLDSQGKHWKNANRQDLNDYFIFRTKNENYSSNVPIKYNSWNLGATVIVHLYEFALDVGLVYELPFKNIKSKASIYGNFIFGNKTHDLSAKSTPEKINFISIDTYKNCWRPLLLNGQNSQRNIALTDLLISSGMRISEALSLKLENIPDPDHHQYAGRKSITISILGKGNKNRVVRIPKKIIRILHFYINEERELCANNRNGSNSVFLSRNGNVLSKRAVESMFKNMSDKLNIRLTPHGCRHTFAIYQLKNMIEQMAINLKNIKTNGSNAYHQLLNDPLRELQRLLGHSYISTTYLYLDFLEESEATVEDSLNNWTNWAKDDE